MKLTRTSKNIALAAVLTSGLAFAGTAAIAQSPADTTGPVTKPGYRQLDPQMVEKHNAFLASTVELRKQMAEKQAVQRAIMAADTPDTAQAGKVAGELFELREQLRAKAQAAGLPYPMLGMGMGKGMGMGGMGCGMADGFGPGDGKGPHRHHGR